MDQHACLSELSEVSSVLSLTHYVLNFHGHARGQAWEHCSSASQHNVLNQRNEIVDVARGQSVENLLMEADVLDSCQHRVKHALSSLEALASNLDCAALLVRQHVLLVEKRGLVCQFTVLLGIVGDEAFGLFDLSHSLKIG